MFTILATLDVEVRSRFVAILWSIWRARNAKTSCVSALDTIQDYMWCNHLNADAQLLIKLGLNR